MPRHFLVAVDRHDQLEVRDIAAEEEGLAVDALVQADGQFERLLRRRRPEGFDAAVGGRRRRQDVDHPAFRVEPDNLRDVRIVLHHVAGADAEEPLPVGLAAEVGGKLLQLFLVACEVEAHVLFEPQHVLDQAGAFLVELVLVQQPEQGDDGSQQQDDAQLGQDEKPAQAPGADGRGGGCMARC